MSAWLSRVRVLVAATAALAALTAHAEQTLVVGSKRFTESYILAEIVTQTAARVGEARVSHRPGLGNTGIVFAALGNGAIDIYPEYTGTIASEITKTEGADLATLNRALAPRGLAAGVALGFDNTYALAMLESRAEELGVRSIGDLARHAQLTLGLSPEFLNRGDGWPGLKSAYALSFTPRGVEHGLAYEAIAARQIDVMDIYSTDATIGKYRLRVLEDDRRYFPEYAAVLLYRADLPARLPRTWAALQQLEGGIAAPRMIAMNAQAELDGASFARIAAEFLSADGAATAPRPEARPGLWRLVFGADFWRLTGQHIALVGLSLAAGVLVGVPLGTWAARSTRAAPAILAVVGVVQTVPSLALLAFLIPLLGSIGTLPALVALFLYSLLPIVRNTYSGLTDIPGPLCEAALALGLPTFARLWRVELPMASRSILAGIKTSAVINVGTATIAAFIGAGGYGERIVSGLALNDNTMLLAGAIPAATLALLVQWSFDGAERILLPEGLR